MPSVLMYLNLAVRVVGLVGHAMEFTFRDMGVEGPMLQVLFPRQCILFEHQNSHTTCACETVSRVCASAIYQYSFRELKGLLIYSGFRTAKLVRCKSCSMSCERAIAIVYPRLGGKRVGVGPCIFIWIGVSGSCWLTVVHEGGCTPLEAQTQIFLAFGVYTSIYDAMVKLREYE
eukprot:2472608-Amphidinium_carterae.2